VKQLFFFSVLLVLQTNKVWCDSPSIKNLDGVQQILLSQHEEKLYVFYDHQVIGIDLNTLKTENISCDIQSFDINEYSGVSTGVNNYFLDNQGGGVLLFENDSVYRVDNSFKHRMQFNSSIFTYNGRVYKYGGYGFWSHRYFITVFDPETREWEFVPFTESDSYPIGRQDAIVKVIDNNLYMFGGTAMDETNGIVKHPLNDIWKFDLKNGIWTELGKITIESDGLSEFPLVDFEESILICNEAEDIMFKIDLKTNQISTYGRNSFLRKIFAQTKDPRFEMFYFKDKFFAFFKGNNELNQIDLVSRNSDEIFGNLISQRNFYESGDKIYKNLIMFFPILFLIIFFIYQTDKQRINNKKIKFSKGELFFKGQKIEMDLFSIRILNQFLLSDNSVSTSEIMDWMNKPQLDYSYRTRLIKETLYKINYTVRNVLKIDYEVITIKKSNLDKRLRVYTIDKTLFLGYPTIKKDIDV
jgi:hypothetical protein